MLRAAIIFALATILVSAGCEKATFSTRGHSKPGDGETAQKSVKEELQPSNFAVVESTKLISAALVRIDSIHPRPQLPKSKPPIFVIESVSADGVVALANGLRVEIDGLACTEKEMLELSKRFLAPNVRLAFVGGTPELGNPIRAQFWLVDISDKDGYSYELIAESALLSGWCAPIPSRTPGLYERYKALAEIPRQSR